MTRLYSRDLRMRSSGGTPATLNGPRFTETPVTVPKRTQPTGVRTINVVCKTCDERSATWATPFPPQAWAVSHEAETGHNVFARIEDAEITVTK
ncbi:DUF7848 domain-containing protein [Streptomyces chrestomyceticus]|uniref:DUF7848 domain-containing protein n=1 Tax=Streptomyces chrestomyceticus TaxID=68185 RepID=UPI00379938F8